MPKVIYSISEKDINRLGIYALYLIKNYKGADWDDQTYFIDSPAFFQMENLNKLMSKSNFDLDEKTAKKAERILINVAREFNKRGIMNVEIDHIW